METAEYPMERPSNGKKKESFGDLKKRSENFLNGASLKKA